jgi:hypothetical protein
MRGVGWGVCWLVWRDEAVGARGWEGVLVLVLVLVESCTRLRRVVGFA